jgi:DNA-binding LytR/AlgR family response regulator
LDYLLKPFSDERFAMTQERAKNQVQQRDAAELSRKLHALLSEHREQAESSVNEPYVTRFLIKEASRVFFVKAEEIDWIEAADYCINLHIGPKSHLLRETMSDLENKLDPATFLRIHRSAIVNLRRVKEVQTRSGGDYFAVMKDGKQLKPLKLSRIRRERLETLLQHLEIGFEANRRESGFADIGDRKTKTFSRRIATALIRRRSMQAFDYDTSSSSAFASRKSIVSNPSVKLP